MSIAIITGLGGLALLLIVILSIYAGHLWREVRRREAFRTAEIARANQNCIESLDALSKAMVDRQVDMVEGALRCKVLLDIIDHRLVERDAWQVLETVQGEAASLHTHQARRALSPRERRREDLARQAIAERHEQNLHQAAVELQVFCRNWVSAT